MRTPLSTFVCWGCGNCCRIPGYVHLTETDTARLATHLGTPELNFIETYTTLTRDRRSLTLREQPDGACVFLEPNGSCRAYAARPDQCRDFPHKWNYPGWEARCENSSVLPGRNPAAAGTRD